MNATHVIAVDPGMTCGWAMAHLLDDHWDPSRVAAGQASHEDWCDWAEVNLNAECLLIVEKFTITARTAQLDTEGAGITIGVIGVMRHLARRSGAYFVNTQSPSDAKNFLTNAQMRKVGLWKPGEDHARDAIRHLVLGLAVFGTGQAREEMLQSLA